MISSQQGAPLFAHRSVIIEREPPLRPVILTHRLFVLMPLKVLSLTRRETRALQIAHDRFGIGLEESGNAWKTDFYDTVC